MSIDPPNRRSVRLSGYDYTSYGAYFVTIETVDRASILGHVTDDNVALSRLDRIFKDEWRRTAELRANIELDEFVVMPNHMHGIVWITDDRAVTSTGMPLHEAPSRYRQRTWQSLIQHTTPSRQRRRACPYTRHFRPATLWLAFRDD